MPEEIEELIPLYALGAATPEEMAEVDAYVAAHPEARQLLDEALATANELAFGVEGQMPADAVRANVLAYAQANPKSVADAAQSGTAPDGEMSAGGQTNAQPGMRDQVGERQTAVSPGWWDRLRQSMAFPVLAGGAAVLAIVLLIWNITLRAENQALQGQLIAMQEQILQQEAVLALLPGSESYPMAGTESSPEARGQLLVSADGRTAIFLASHLQTLLPQQTYQLWFIGGDEAVGQGTFNVDERGDGRLVIQAGLPPSTFDAVGVSIEPAQGSLQPTGDIVLFGELAPTGNSG